MIYQSLKINNFPALDEIHYHWIVSVVCGLLRTEVLHWYE